MEWYDKVLIRIGRFFNYLNTKPSKWYTTCLKFVVDKCENQPHTITYRKLSKSIYEVEIDFTDVNMRLKYDFIKDIWGLSVWSKGDEKYLFDYDHFDSRPEEVINYLVRRFNVDIQFSEMYKYTKSRQGYGKPVCNKAVSIYK